MSNPRAVSGHLTIKWSIPEKHYSVSFAGFLGSVGAHSGLAAVLTELVCEDTVFAFAFRPLSKGIDTKPRNIVSNGMDAPVKEASSVPEWQVQDQPLRMKESVQDEGYDHRY